MNREKMFFAEWISLLVGMLMLSACAASLPVTPKTQSAQQKTGAAATFTASAIDDRRPVAPTSSPTPTSTPYPLLSPTVQAMEFISTTIPLPNSKSAHSAFNGGVVFVVKQSNPAAQNTAPNAIFSYNLQDKTMIPLARSVHGAEGAVCCLKVSENWVVWLDYIHYFAEWKFFAKNLNSGEELLISQQADTNVVTPPSFAISGDNLIWTAYERVDSGAIKSFVMRYNLAQKTSETLTEAIATDDLAIDGDQAVWVQRVSSEKRKLVLYSLVTRQQTQIIADGYVEQPQISGNYLVWLRPRRGAYGVIVVHNLKSGHTVQLPYKSDYLQLGDKLLLWWDSSNETMIYDLEENIATELFEANDKLYCDDMHIWQRQVVLFTRSKANDQSEACELIEIRDYLN